MLKLPLVPAVLLPVGLQLAAAFVVPGTFAGTEINAANPGFWPAAQAVSMGIAGVAVLFCLLKVVSDLWFWWRLRRLDRKFAEEMARR